MLIDGVMLLWFVLTALSVVFVAIDVRSTPENPVLKWGFVLITLYAGPFGAFLYVLGCREPLPGLHERYVAVRWRQVLGSTMHCVAGDGVGILAGAVIGAAIALPKPAHLGLEYGLGFGFGWTIFQALFMRDMAGGSFAAAMRRTFVPELVSMNFLMGGMIPVMTLAFAGAHAAHDPLAPLFWFRMSLALMVGFAVAYPANWWLVANKLKHGMMTVRPGGGAPVAASAHAGHGQGEIAHAGPDTVRGEADAPRPAIGAMTALSFVVLAAGLAIGLAFGAP